MGSHRNHGVGMYRELEMCRLSLQVGHGPGTEDPVHRFAESRRYKYRSVATALHGRVFAFVEGHQLAPLPLQGLLNAAGNFE